MNLIGKILVVVITVMSISFMAVAFALYSTHTNWKAKIDDQTSTITELNTELETLETQYKRNVASLKLEIETAEQQVRKLERERVAIVAQNDDMRGKLESLKQDRRDVTAEIAKTQNTNKEIADKNIQLQQEIAATQTATDAAFTRAVEATSALHEAKMKLESELERNAQLLEQVQGNL